MRRVGTLPAGGVGLGTGGCRLWLDLDRGLDGQPAGRVGGCRVGVVPRGRGEVRKPEAARSEHVALRRASRNLSAGLAEYHPFALDMTVPYCGLAALVH